MTWSERVGDLASNIALVAVNAIRILTLPAKLLSEKLDTFVSGLGETSEKGLAPADTPRNSWLRLPSAVFWGIAAIILRTLSIATVFVRQACSTIDDFLRVLVEGE